MVQSYCIRICLSFGQHFSEANPIALCRAKGSARGWRGGAVHDDQDRGQDDEGNLDLTVYHDGYKERIEALITSKMKGEVAQVREEKPKMPVGQEHDGGAKGDRRILEVTRQWRSLMLFQP